MDGKDFIRAGSRGKVDALQLLLTVLRESGTAYCVVGGLAVNAYAEPVVSLDAEFVVPAGELERVCQAAALKGLRAEKLDRCRQLTRPDAELRLCLPTDARYQGFLCRAAKRSVLGYELLVAAAGDVLHGKLWAHADPRRRASKRQQDLADILRLVEAQPQLKSWLPPKLLAHLD